MARWKQHVKSVPVLGRLATFELALDLKVPGSLLERSHRIAGVEQQIWQPRRQLLASL
jgi:hypothetical protein